MTIPNFSNLPHSGWPHCPLRPTERKSATLEGPPGWKMHGPSQSLPSSWGPSTQPDLPQKAFQAPLPSPLFPQPAISPLAHSGDGEPFAHWSLNIGHMPLNHLIHICCSHNSALDNLGAQSMLAEVKGMADKHLELVEFIYMYYRYSYVSYETGNIFLMPF